MNKKSYIIPSKTNNKNMERYLHKKLSEVGEGGGGGGSDPEAIKYTEQTLTAEQQTQARTNIGAGTYSKPDGGIPATDLAEGVIPTIDDVPTSESDNLVKSGGVYSEIHPATVTAQPQNGFLPNIFYNLGELTGNITFALATPSDNTIVNHYYWTFETGSTAPTITWGALITSWYGGSAPTISAGKHYEISVINGVAVYMEV